MENTSNMVARIPGLVDWSTDEVRLIGAKCKSCGTCFFPKGHYQHAPGCAREGNEDILFPNKGKLASYVIQHYMPPPPFKTEKKIVPYAIGLVEFEDEKIQIAGILKGVDLNNIELGTEMETTTLKLFSNDEKQDVVTWAFQPVK